MYIWSSEMKKTWFDFICATCAISFSIIKCWEVGVSIIIWQFLRSYINHLCSYLLTPTGYITTMLTFVYWSWSWKGCVFKIYILQLLKHISLVLFYCHDTGKKNHTRFMNSIFCFPIGFFYWEVDLYKWFFILMKPKIKINKEWECWISTCEKEIPKR